MSRRSPSRRYIVGVVRRWPLLAPIVVSRSKGLPSQNPPTLPLFARNSSIVWLFQSFMSGMLSYLLNYLCCSCQQLTCERGLTYIECMLTSIFDKVNIDLSQWMYGLMAML